jgi:subtilisin family serine protease
VVLSAAVVVSLLGLTAGAGPAAAQEGGDPPGLQATPLSGAELVEGAKSASGKAARTDPGLLALDDPAPVSVVVKLDYDALAAYAGDIEGLEPTSPSVTGEPLDASAPAALEYDAYAAGIESTFVQALDAAIPAAAVGESLRVVYGGVAVQVPGDRIDDLLALPGVVAVQSNAPLTLHTDSSPEFTGATAVYPALGGRASAGAGVIVGVLDTGAWPEHPGYADPGTLPAPPPKADGTPRTCDFGDNPLTPASDVFVCNDKLIGGQPFLDTYNAVIGGEVYPDSARDSNGHGTHTSTTAAGGPVADADPLGISRGPIHGMAPAAHVSMYKVCGVEGCFPSDSAAAVAQAIADGADVLNFSISGGENPFSDVVELAFLDAYAAGVFVAASAGNEGPGPDTLSHRGPWVTTVGASTQERAFTSTVTLTGGGGATVQVTGGTITSGIASALPVVRGADPPYSNAGCTAPAAPGVFTGRIVVCEIGPGRVARGFNVSQGGAAGMLLVNAAFPAPAFTDNHFLPAVNVDKPEADTIAALLAANPGATASFTTGAASPGVGDRMARFSSRGPGGDWLKPDVTAPGVQILAGHTPTPDDVAGGPPGNLYQAIAGTSMASPHVAGAAALLMDLHPGWTPGQVRSALATTATTDLVDADLVSPTDPFDRGSGRIRVDRAAHPGLTFDSPAADFVDAGSGALATVDVNMPSVSAPVMPGTLTTTRTATNVTRGTVRYRATATADDPGATVTVRPRTFTLAPGQSIELTVTISGPALAPGQYFGQIDLQDRDGHRDLHVPVSFVRQQGDVSLTQTCDPTTITRPEGRSTCTVRVENLSQTDTTVDARTHLDAGLRISAVDGATQTGFRDAVASAELAGFVPGNPNIAPGAGPAGYLPLDAFGITPVPIGDEAALNLNTPAFVYGQSTYTSLGITSNGYLVVGGTTGTGDIEFVPQTFPDPARPNNVLAPFWTDLDGTGAPGILVATLTDGVDSWIVVEWRLNVFGTTSQRVFQTWIGINGVEDVTFAYDPANLPADPAGFPFNVGAENADGTGGSQIAGLPTGDLRVTTSPAVPGGALTYSVEVKGVLAGTRNVTTSVTAPIVNGTTTEVDAITVL